jgi:hypothetical protein
LARFKKYQANGTSFLQALKEMEKRGKETETDLERE